jgi:hypothetical protein
MSWSATKVVASVAVVALGASLLVTSVPRQAGPADPGAVSQADTPSPMASIIPAGDLAVPVVGTTTYVLDSLPDEGGSTGVTADFIEWTRSDGWYSFLTVEMSDPRLSGTLWYNAASDDFGWPDKVGEGLEIFWGMVRIENAGGAWEGPYRGGAIWDVEDLGAPPPSFHDVVDAVDHWTWDGWLEGSGDYEGLSAWIRRDEQNDQDATMVGLIFPGPPPPDR